MRSTPFSDIVATLARQALGGAAEPELLTGACARLVAAGVPLLRAAIGIDTLHPVLEGRIAVWRRDAAEAEAHDYLRSASSENPDSWRRSPFSRLYETRQESLRRQRGVSYVAGEFPLVDELMQAGASDYLAYVTPLGESAAVGGSDFIYSSWATDREPAFTSTEIALI